MKTYDEQCQSCEENTLVALAQSGDMDALGALLQRVHHEKVVHTVMQRCGAQYADAEDAYGDACIRVLKNIQTFDGRSSFQTWFTKIVLDRYYQIYLQQHRGTKKKERPLSSIGVTEKPVHLLEGETGEPEVDCLRMIHEICELIREARHSLAEKSNIILDLFLEGLSYPQIAERCNVPIGTVRSTLSRTRARLQEEVPLGFSYC
jgi:RNA polymerase sigma-70 factor (ECF subfamily)